MTFRVGLPKSCFGGVAGGDGLSADLSAIEKSAAMVASTNVEAIEIEYVSITERNHVN